MLHCFLYYPVVIKLEVMPETYFATNTYIHIYSVLIYFDIIVCKL